MGKKRIVKKGPGAGGSQKAGARSARLARKKLPTGILYVEATYNNTKVVLTDTEGNAITWSSSGSLGFRGAKKGTPFAAAKVGETVGERAKTLGTKEIRVIVKGTGSGRESAIRGFLAQTGSALEAIEDRTPVPFNGPRPRKPRRV
jgi:small subunit ribosomal protein S11